jgi:archaellum component FlaC
MATTNCTCANCMKVWDDVPDNVNVRYDYTTSTTSATNGNVQNIVFENMARSVSDFAPVPTELDELHTAYNKALIALNEAQKKISCQNEEIERRDRHIKQLDKEITDRAKEYNRLFVKQSETDRACNDLIRQLQERDEQIAHLQAQLSASAVKPDYNSLLGSYEAANDTIKQIIQQREWVEKELENSGETQNIMAGWLSDADTTIRYLANMLTKP